jgi:hypothetical protein
MIIKTVDFVKQFFDDFYQIVFYAKNYSKIKRNFFAKVLKESQRLGQPYEKVLNRELDDRNNFTDPGYTGNKKIPPLFNFVGSFATKDFGKIMSDIDVNQSPNFRSEGVIIRLKEIIAKTDPLSKSPDMPFYFIRFYLGKIKGYEPPWEYNQQGNCEFDISELNSWLIKIKTLVPLEVFDSINDKINKDTLSLKDLVEIDELTKKYTSITWLTQDVQAGYKEIDGVKYNLVDLLQNTSSKIVVKFIYEYNNEDGKDTQNLRKDYMLVDLSLNQTRGDLISLTYYYLNDLSYKFKSLKRYLPESLVQTYRDDFGENAGYLTTVGTRLDLLDKIQRYNFNQSIMSDSEFQSLRDDLNDFAESHGYSNINPDFRLQSVKEMDRDVQREIKRIREKLFEEYEQKITNKKEEFYYYLIRGEEASLQISKVIILERFSCGIKCPFFFLVGKDLKLLIKFAIKFSLDPVKLTHCINDLANITGFDSSNIFNELHLESFDLEQTAEGNYNFFLNELLIQTNSIDQLNTVLNTYNLRLTYKNREYSLYEEEQLLITEKLIDQMNTLLESRGLYLKYDHYSENKYSLYQWHTESISNLSIESVQLLFILKLLK